jgi:HEPN domain-containing protein
MSAPEHGRPTLTWLRRAGGDFELADKTLRERDPDVPWNVAFLAQRAAEKALKGLLVHLGIEPPRTHDLARLLSLVPEEKAEVRAQTGVLALTEYAITGQYPVRDLQVEPTWEDAEKAVALARSLLDACRSAVEQTR